MYFRRFYDEQLAQASYLIGCQANGTAIVIDPARSIQPYLEVAAAEGFMIVAVTETHIHADFVSGIRELAAATDAKTYVSGCGTPDWQYEFRSAPNVAVLADRDVITIGNVKITAVHTPGHTPEHLAFLVTDGAVAEEPMGVVTGDFVFVGDVGRPDLLEKAAHVANTAAAGARDLYRSLTWFKTLPDYVQVWPGHGAGSACGKGLGAVPQSTVGYERRFNWALGVESEAEFVRQVLAGQPEPPRYFGRMKQVNRSGAAVLGPLPPVPSLNSAAFKRHLTAGAMVVDTRLSAEFAAGHVPGTINIPVSKSFTTHAGSVLPFDQEICVVLADATAGEAMARNLRSIGFDRIGGIIEATVVDAWKGRGNTLGGSAEITIEQLVDGPATNRRVIDVRNRSEWDAGHMPGATLIPLPELIDRLDEIPKDAEILVHCQSGGRSAIASSVLKSRGYERVANLIGGFSAWVGMGGKIER